MSLRHEEEQILVVIDTQRLHRMVVVNVVQKGDTVYLTEAPEGGYRIAPYNPDFERQMKLAEEIMHDDRNILRALAK